MSRDEDKKREHFCELHMALMEAQYLKKEGVVCAKCVGDVEVRWPQLGTMRFRCRGCGKVGWLGAGRT